MEDKEKNECENACESVVKQSDLEKQEKLLKEIRKEKRGGCGRTLITMLAAFLGPALTFVLFMVFDISDLDDGIRHVVGLLYCLPCLSLYIVPAAAARLQRKANDRMPVLSDRAQVIEKSCYKDDEGQTYYRVRLKLAVGEVVGFSEQSLYHLMPPEGEWGYLTFRGTEMLSFVTDSGMRITPAGVWRIDRTK